jgi:cold shock CspA family protein
VNYFNEGKGFGFITDATSGERVFFHVNQLTERVGEGDKVRFETEQGPKGLNAIQVEKVKS